MEHVSIAEAKRDLSRVVNKVVFGREPVILTSRGRPKAVIISHEEFERLNKELPRRNIVKLGGIWAGTPDLTEEDFKKIRAEVWGSLGRLNRRRQR
ncbi:MAG: type II toxin-antitoxin system Phd/YefM family antitoxin [Armatimonadetes bacterium]|nr:type II toxin-antitoxin system Phd/YefM family antitoxin [Armatimonadota bacterium]